MASKKKSPRKTTAKRRSTGRKRPASRKKTSRRPWLTATVFFLLGVAIAGGIMFLSRPELAPSGWQRLRRRLTAIITPTTPRRPTPGQKISTKAPAAGKKPPAAARQQPAAPKQVVLTIYQADPDYANLISWRQPDPHFARLDRQQRARRIFALLNRDTARGKSPLPPNVHLQRVSFHGDVITVDLSPTVVDGLAHSGSTDEMLAVYGLVNSFLANFPGYHRVQITVNGRVIPTLAGHIDTLQPLAFWRER